MHKELFGASSEKGVLCDRRNKMRHLREVGGGGGEWELKSTNTGR